MPANDISQPHDRFFKQLFGRKETAAAFLSAYLPDWLVSSADWQRLELQPGSYVDSKLRHQESDLLFRVPFKDRKIFLYCVFEHQRTVDPWLLLRLLSYIVQIWQELLKADPKLNLLPPIVPLVLFQGPGGWNVSVRLLDRLAIPQEMVEELRQYQPGFEHLLVDLSQVSVDQLRGDVAGRLGLGLMKAVAENRVATWLERAGPLIGELLRRDDVPGIIQTLLNYVLAADSNADLEGVLQQAEPEIRNRLMSIAQELIERGRQEGRDQGRHEGVQAGTVIGQIQILEEILKLPISPLSELKLRSTEELQRQVQELRGRLSTGSH
jgi:predicted transposase YdaD